jgi:hypothetical protein
MKPQSFFALAAAGFLVAGCSTGSAVLDSVSGVGDRFTQLFGSDTQAATGTGAPEQDNEQYCPPVSIRDGTATLTAAAQASTTGISGTRYQGTITRTARECVLRDGNVIAAKVGIQGRVIVGPAGAPPTVEIPIRIAVVEEGVEPKTVFSRFYTTSVSMTQGNVPFSFVAEDVSYPAPPPSAGASYIFYVGFDPEGARKSPPRVAKKKGR